MVASNLTSLFLAALVSSSTFRTQNNRASDASPLRGSPRKLQATDEKELGKMVCGAYRPGCIEGEVWWKDGDVELRGGPLRDIYFYDKRVPLSLHRTPAGTDALTDFTRKAADVDAGADGKLNIKSTSTDASKWTLAAEQFGFLQRTDKLFIISWCRFAAVEFGYAEINVGDLYDLLNPAPTTPAPTTVNAGATTSAECNTVCTSASGPTKIPFEKTCRKYCNCAGAGSGTMMETAFGSIFHEGMIKNGTECPIQCGSTRFNQRAASCDECKNKSRPNPEDRCSGGPKSSCKWVPGACVPRE